MTEGTTVAATAYRYTGADTRCYLAYLNLDTRETLVAQPGNEYRLAAVSPHLETPPPDGNWVTVEKTSRSRSTATATTASDDAPTGDEK